MDEPVALVALAAVVVAAFVAGFAFGAAAFAAKVEAALKISSELDGELAAVISAQLATNRSATSSLPGAGPEKGAQDAPEAHQLGFVHAAGPAANDAIGAPQYVPPSRKPPLFGPGRLLRRAGAPASSCTVCAKIRKWIRL